MCIYIYIYIYMYIYIYICLAERVQVWVGFERDLSKGFDELGGARIGEKQALAAAANHWPGKGEPQKVIQS